MTGFGMTELFEQGFVARHIEGAARSESEEDRNAYLLAAKMTAFNIASFT